MHDGRMIVKNSNCHTLISCVTTANNPKDSMMVGLQIFIEKEEMVLDSNFWCGCPENIQNQCSF